MAPYPKLLGDYSIWNFNDFFLAQRTLAPDIYIWSHSEEGERKCQFWALVKTASETLILIAFYGFLSIYSN